MITTCVLRALKDSHSLMKAPVVSHASSSTYAGGDGPSTLVNLKWWRRPGMPFCTMSASARLRPCTLGCRRPAPLRDQPAPGRGSYPSPSRPSHLGLFNCMVSFERHSRRDCAKGNGTETPLGLPLLSCFLDSSPVVSQGPALVCTEKRIVTDIIPCFQRSRSISARQSSVSSTSHPDAERHRRWPAGPSRKTRPPAGYRVC
ncbi:hypothetical protein GGR56DRAFT_589648 [Xylariaceae sp. FL0804]|nr:hypothetical protein GGR56DRAFT_589648 [Xylariaceae sp. FL0804]